MPEDVVVVENEVKEPATPVVATVNPFDDASWSTTPIETLTPAEKIAAIKPVIAGDEEVVDELEYLEKQTGYKSWEEVKALKAEAEQLRAKAQTPAEIKFANEQSKKLHDAWVEGKEDEVFSFLDNKRKLSAAANLPAAEAIKLHLQQTNPHFKSEDVEDVFEERYSLPKKPVQSVGEEAEDFQERMTEYNTRVAKVNRAIERDAVAAKADLATRITQLVPPEIPKREQGSTEPTQEALEARKTFLENFVKAVPKELENFKGFSTTFKDDVVELPISYVITPEEVKVYQGKLEAFANANLDVNTLFSKKWVNEDGSVNIKQAAHDLYVLDNLDKILQKVANESGAKRLAHQMKLNSNIKVNGERTTTKVDQPDPKKAQIDHIWQNG